MASPIGSVVSTIPTVHLATLGLRWLSGLPFDVRSGFADLAVSLTGTEVEPTSDRVPVTGLITLENSSHVRVRVLGAVYNIVGLPSSPNQQSYEKTVAETFASNPTTADSIWPTSVARDAYG